MVIVLDEKIENFLLRRNLDCFIGLLFQVCQILSKGNWTLERDEDLTAPYSYLGTKWVAFDDDTSLKIKVMIYKP